MKKILVCILGFMILVSSSAFAVDVTVGASTWYAGCKIQGDYMNYMKYDPIFLYGPALAIKFNDNFNLTGVLLYGKTNAKIKYTDESYNAKRMDSNFALNFRLNDYLKIFAGIKYMSYNIVDYSDFDHSGYGPGIGISVAYPIADSLFLLATLSGFRLLGEQEYDDYGVKIESDYKEYGVNTTLALAYYIPSISTAISLGGRYQQFKTFHDDDYYHDDWKWKFYGITLTVTYTF